MSWLTDLQHLLLPTLCPICHKPLGDGEQIVCARCMVQLPYRNPEDPRNGKLARLFWGRIPIENAIALLHYTPDSYCHEIFMDLKYRHRPTIGVSLGRLLGWEIKQQACWQDIDALVPVPLHWQRYLSRGYNQSYQIARGIHAVTGIPIDRGIVRRIKNNQTQTELNASERMENVEGIFRGYKTKYKHIMLIDDVITTGATTTSCAEAIIAANPTIKFSIAALGKA